MFFKNSRQRWIAWCSRLPAPEPETADIAARARAAQLGTILQLSPHMMSVNIINASMAVVFLYPHVHPVPLLGWFALVCAMGVFGLLEWWRRRNAAPRLRASRKSLTVLTRNAGLLGLLWGCLGLIGWADAPSETRIIIVALMAGMAGGGCLTLYVTPSAMTLWVGGITAGSLAALALEGKANDWALATLLFIYSLALLKAGRTASVSFVGKHIASEKIREQSETIAMLLSDFSEGARDWLWETDRTGTLIRGGKPLLHHIGLTPVTADGPVPPQALRASPRALARLRWLFRRRKPFRNLITSFGGPDGPVWISISGKPIHDEEGVFKGYRGVASDVTNIQKAEEQIAYLAWHDPLTGLGNRASFSRHLEASLAERQNASLFYLDLDGFKAVNDQFGHGMGDRLLAEVATRLRKSVGRADVVARLGGDEFSILSSGMRTRQQAARLAQRLVERISKPYAIDGAVLRISVSIGIAFGDAGNRDTAEWLNRADLALYRAKHEGKAGFRFYEAAMDELLRRRRFIERELRHAVARNEISVAFQPYRNARTGRISGFEALARWAHPDLGEIPPAEFIPVAERIGMIGQIGNTVLRQACAFAVNWPSDIQLAANLSPQQLQAGTLAGFVSDALRETGLCAQRLELEITESTFINNTAPVLSQLGDLKALGVSIALDDFGTGYSALSYLLQFPFDKLKIDQSLVAPAATDPAARDMLDTVLKLARVLGLSTTAEGVETEKQAQILIELGCDFLQGYGISRPLTAGKLPLFLMENAGENGKDDAARAFPANIESFERRELVR
ncbi:MAG: EAL domain-containing protein [Zhengella sp.]|uniref:putative bifunctional diguanylate cyclase/phosphodiesterase n=1 Tax=Zhengella sp. TaxID=2282762 RepID=UPI003527CED3